MQAFFRINFQLKLRRCTNSNLKTFIDGSVDLQSHPFAAFALLPLRATAARIQHGFPAEAAAGSSATIPEPGVQAVANNKADR